MDHDHPEPPPFWRSPAGLTLCVALLLAGFYLLTEHTAHVLGALPYVFVLACPLMHIFMHRGHHGGHTNSPKRPDDDQRQQ
jgi:hypothetical protein